MDPITAVGFAASILQFIEFSWGVITGTYEVYKSTTGTTHENAHISTVVNDLERATDRLISDVEGKTKNEKELCNLADKCHELSQDLSKILKKLQASEKSSKWLSLKVKVASMRKEKEIASIEDRLDRYRSQILVRLNFMLW
jgi:chromosome segregation ATPase